MVKFASRTHRVLFSQSRFFGHTKPFGLDATGIATQCKRVAVCAFPDAIVVFFGIYTAISRKWHPWKVLLAYLIAGLFLCYAGAVVTTLYVIGDTI